jgi:hypothetical protein
MQASAPERRFRQAVKQGWTQFIRATRPRYHLAKRLRKRRALAPGIAAGVAVPAIDPVALTVLAVNRLGPATLRTVANGRPLTVTVPDARTGDIFRAALAEMQKTRLTDRLIAIVIADEAKNAERTPNDA